MADRQDTIQQILSQESIPFPANKRFKNISGEDINKLTVIRYAGKKGHSHVWDCVCECGKAVYNVSNYSMRSGNTKSCGCWKRALRIKNNFKHGKTRSPEWRTWRAMLHRCQSPDDTCFHLYGARGITVCDRWQGNDGFANFLADMGEKPEGTSLDRIDNNNGYSPENCRWATSRQQSRNTRRNVMIEYNGKVQCVADWADEIGVPYRTLHCRIRKYKWSVHRALTTL